MLKTKDTGIDSQNDREGPDQYGITIDVLDDSNPQDPVISIKVTNSRSEIILDWVGGVTTFLAMLPQGIFGGLMIDKLLDSLGALLLARIVNMVIITVTAEEGKRRLLQFYNEKDFKNLFTFIKNLQPKYWGVANAVNAGFTILISAVFAYLASLSLTSVSELLTRYHTKPTDIAADYIDNLYVQLPFIIAAALTNLLGFPNIMRGFYAQLNDIIRAVIENPVYRKERDVVKRHLESVRKQWIQEIANNRANTWLFGELSIEVNLHQDCNAILNSLQNIENLREKLVAIKPNKIISQESWLSYIGKHTLGYGFSALAMAGMWNFRSMGSAMCQAVGLDIIAPYVGWGVDVAMNIMMFTIVRSMVLEYADSIAGRTPNLNIQSLFWRLFIPSIALVVCTLGGTPNAYQSYLAGESTIMMILATVGSLLTEYAGFCALTSSHRDQAIIKKDIEKALNYEINKILKKQSDLSTATREQIYGFYNVIINNNQSPQSPEVEVGEALLGSQATPPEQYRSSYRWFSRKAESIYQKTCCFFRKSKGITSIIEEGNIQQTNKKLTV